MKYARNTARHLINTNASDRRPSKIKHIKCEKDGNLTRQTLHEFYIVFDNF